MGWSTRRQLAVAALAGVFFAGDMALWSTGVMLAGVASPTLLANTAPMWVGLGAVVFFREQPPALFWAGLVLAFAGTLSILGPDVLLNARLLRFGQRAARIPKKNAGCKPGAQWRNNKFDPNGDTDRQGGA